MLPSQCNDDDANDGNGSWAIFLCTASINITPIDEVLILTAWLYPSHASLDSHSGSEGPFLALRGVWNVSEILLLLLSPVCSPRCPPLSIGNLEYPHWGQALSDFIWKKGEVDDLPSLSWVSGSKLAKFFSWHSLKLGRKNTMRRLALYLVADYDLACACACEHTHVHVCACTRYGGHTSRVVLVVLPSASPLSYPS